VYTDLATFYNAAKEGITTYGNVAIGPAIGVAAVRVRVPVVNNGAVRYVISAPHRLEWFESMLREQQPPTDWMVALLDSNKQFIARVPPSTPSSSSVHAALQGVSAGSFNAGTLDGQAIYATSVISARTGWTLAVAIPQRVIDGPAWRVLVVLLACGTVALVITVIVALKLAGRVTADYRRAS
jgi:two-component system sensor histidine kinase UhpB